jgi:hypothetical protein
MVCMMLAKVHFVALCKIGFIDTAKNWSCKTMLVKISNVRFQELLLIGLIREGQI